MPFPKFDDGDVEVRFNSVEESWILHSWVLALHSEWFKAALSQRWNKGRANRIEPRGRIVYELRFDKDTADGSLMREPGKNAEFLAYATDEALLAEEEQAAELATARLDVMQAHQDVLGALYHVSPDFGVGMGDMTQTYLRSVCKTADFYSCRSLMSLHIDKHIRQYSDKVLSDCEEDPLEMLALGLDLQSELITQEVCVHLIDEPQEDHDEGSAELHDLGMAELILHKRELLAKKLRAVDLALLQHSPAVTGLRPFTQIATNALRQRVVDEIDGTANMKLGVLYPDFYRQIGQGVLKNDALDFKKHALKPCAKHLYEEQLQEFRVALSVVLSSARPIVEPVLRDLTQRKRSGPLFDRLSCVGLDADEFPWLSKSKA